MLENLLAYERDIFLSLNGCHTPFFDNFFWLYSGKIIWLPLAIVILICLINKRNWRETVLVLLSIFLVILLCDQFASHICKPLFTRFRPTHHPDFMDKVKIVYNYRGGMYGFISSHAANAFGFATFMYLLLRNKWLSFSLFLWAVVNSYSRIYLGVHFISDIVPGALSGILWGFLVYYLFIRVTSHLKLPISYDKKRIYWIVAVFWLTHLFLILISAYKTYTYIYT